MLALIRAVTEESKARGEKIWWFERREIESNNNLEDRDTKDN